jgi:hypothetical protein
MPGPFNFDAYLGWVNITDPNNIPEDARTIGADDLLRYEQLGLDVKQKFAEVDSAVANLDSDTAVAASIAEPASQTRAAVQILVDDGVAGFQAVIDTVPDSVAAQVPPLVSTALAADSTVATAAANAVTAEINGRDLVEGGEILEEAIAFGVTDEDGRRLWIESDYDGKPTDYAGEKIVEKIGPAISASVEQGLGLDTMETEVTGLSFAIVDEDSRILPDAEWGPDGLFTQRVIDSIASRINVVAEPPTHFEDASGRLIRVSSGPDIVGMGDSLTAAGQYLAKLAELSGRTVRNCGVGGETSIGIAARQGASPYLMMPVGGILPASGAVDVTFTGANGGSSWPLLQGTGIRDSAPGNPNNYALGTLAGVHGRFSMRVKDPAVAYPLHGAGDVYEFTRDAAGTAIVFNEPEPFIYDNALLRRGDITVIWAGQNGPSDDATFNEVKAMVDYLNAAKAHFIVMPAPGPVSVPDTALELRFRAEYGRNFLNIRQYLIKTALKDAGMTPTAQDITDAAAGQVPDSLRTDSVHHEVFAQHLIGTQVYKRMKELEIL